MVETAARPSQGVKWSPVAPVARLGESWEAPASPLEQQRLLAAVKPLRGLGVKSWGASSLIRGWLGNNVNTATPPSTDALKQAREEAEREKRQVQVQANRRVRYALRTVAQLYTVHSNVGKCGRCRRTTFGGGQGGGVTLMRHPERGAYFTGLCHCGSVWEDPACAYSICHQRATELRTLAERHREAGGGVYMLTLTMPHDVGDDLKPMVKHVARAWSKVQAGAQYKRAKQRIGWVGSVASREVTVGVNGWHLHLHVMVLTEKPLEHPNSGLLGKDAEAYRSVVYDRWCNYITERNEITGKIYRKPSREHGVTLVVSRKDDYITKMGLADELARGSWKSAKEIAGHRTPFRVLRDLSDALEKKREYSARDVAIWKEYAVAMRGMRQLTWSRGLRSRYALGPEQTDLELVEQDENPADAELIAVISDAHWDRYLRNNYNLRCDLLAAAEGRGADAVRALMDEALGLRPVPF